MLVLTRWSGQKIRIGDLTTVELVKIRDDARRVGISITAPRSIKIRKGEDSSRDSKKDPTEEMNGNPYKLTTLHLKRYEGEEVVIEEDIVVSIVRIFPEKVRFGIDAPPDLPVHREEVYERIQQEKRRGEEEES